MGVRRIFYHLARAVCVARQIQVSQSGWLASGDAAVAHSAVHVHGELGIDMTYPVHRYFTAAGHNEFALGGAITRLAASVGCIVK